MQPSGKSSLATRVGPISLKTKNPFQKKVPNIPAKEFDVDHIELSTNDNNNYTVVADKNGLKRWKKMK